MSRKRNVIALLERARALCEPRTWYQLSKQTGIAETTISRCRRRGGTLDDKTLETSHVPAHGRTNGHGLYGRRPSPRRRNQRVLAPQTPAPTAVGCNCECRTLGTRGSADRRRTECHHSTYRYDALYIMRSTTPAREARTTRASLRLLKALRAHGAC